MITVHGKLFGQSHIVDSQDGVMHHPNSSIFDRLRNRFPVGTKIYMNCSNGNWSGVGVNTNISWEESIKNA